jgi:hypothetical protein
VPDTAATGSLADTICTLQLRQQRGLIDMSQRWQDRCGDRADRRTPPGIYPVEPDRWRLLWHIIVTVLLLAALASTATWLLLDPV